MTMPAGIPDEELRRRIAEGLARAGEMCEAQEYYEAHEVLEHVWLHCTGLERDFLGGVILMAAALHKARKQHNPRAARVIYARGLRRLATVPDRFHGIDVRTLELETLTALRDHDHPTRLKSA